MTTPHQTQGLLAPGCALALLALLATAGAAWATTEVAAWGDGTYGQTNVPPGLTDIVALSAKELHTVALRADGTVVSWGESSRTNVPAGLSNVVGAAAGGVHSAAVTTGGTVTVWSCCGSLWGLTNVPPGLTNVVSVACGYSYVLALKGDGSVACWGEPARTNLPAGLASVTNVTAGSYHNLAIKSDGTVVAWGDNGYGKTNVPAGLSNVVAVAAGQNHSLALRSDGTAVGWGWDGSGQATPPAGLSNVIAIAAGGNHSLALKADGTLAAWGDPAYSRNATAATMTNVIAIADGLDYSLALTSLPSSNADLAGLVLSAGTLTPAFDAAVTHYAATVVHSVTSLAVTATCADSTATIQVRVNGGAFSNVLSGLTSPPLPLNYGANLIDIKVTAQDLSTIKTYTAAVTRLTNQPPVANAGADRNAYTGQTITLLGSASDPGGDPIAAWAWEMDQAPAGASWVLAPFNDRFPEFTGFVPGDYVVLLMVADSFGLGSAPDFVTIHVADNQAPVAAATADKTTITVGDTVCFDGSQSSDPEGGPLSYRWDFADGSPCEFGQVAPCHTFTTAGTFDVGVQVIDVRNANDIDIVQITVFGRPTVVATANRVSGPSSLPVQFDGSQTRAAPGRALVSFLWDFGDGTTSTNVSATHQFAPGLHTVSLTVTDDLGGIGTNSLQVHLGHGDNWPPVADAGTNRWVATNTATTLNGSATDPDSQSIVAWSWTVVSAPPGAQYTLADPADPHSNFSAQTPGSYLLSLTASDGTDWSLPDTVTVWVGINLPPVANAGADRNAYTGQTITLLGSASDPGGDPIAAWAWEMDQAPAGASWVLAPFNDRFPEFTGFVPGDYVVLLMVADSFGLGSAPDFVTIHVTPPPLRIERTSPSTVLLAWPAALTGYGLEQNANLNTTNWLPVTNPPVVVGAEKQVTVPPAVSPNFYRLHKP